MTDFKFTPKDKTVLKNNVMQNSESHKPKDILHVEICQQENSTISEKILRELAVNELDREMNHNNTISLHKSLLPLNFKHGTRKHIKSIYCAFKNESLTEVQYEANLHELKFYYYRLNQEEGATEAMENDGEGISASSHWVLPSKEFWDLWENLHYKPGVKENLLNFVETAMIFAERNVNSHIISWNKIVLLHGPPGTGKTSLCKALAQKVAIRLSDRFTRGELVEINSHSLFSKWFSESGKLVMKLFNEIKTHLQDDKAFVCILIDEIESLAHARKACSNGTEPSDSIRVVNALLTQLDSIKRYPNVLILTTSNLTEAIDIAFADRADITQYIGPPNAHAIYKIYFSCIKELMRTKLIEEHIILDLNELFKVTMQDETTVNSIKLWQLSQCSTEISGRSLRKLPFLAHALYMKRKQSHLEEFLDALKAAILNKKNESIEPDKKVTQF